MCSGFWASVLSTPAIPVESFLCVVDGCPGTWQSPNGDSRSIKIAKASAHKTHRRRLNILNKLKHGQGICVKIIFILPKTRAYGTDYQYLIPEHSFDMKMATLIAKDDHLDHLGLGFCRFTWINRAHKPRHPPQPLETLPISYGRKASKKRSTSNGRPSLFRSHIAHDILLFFWHPFAFGQHPCTLLFQFP